MNQLQNLRGMVDLFPEQTLLWQAVEKIARDQFHLAGIKEIRTPLLEITDLFNRGIGEETDVVGKEMYTFIDRGERSCTLRPEGTASVVRAVLQKGLLSQGPQRLWYGGPMFRYERPQAGRQRQFHQLGVECIGVGDFRSDAEIIGVAWMLLHDLGIEDLVLEINTLGSSEDRKNYQQKLVKWLETRQDQMDEDSRRRLTTNPLRILDSKSSAMKDLLQNAPTLIESICEESTVRFENVKNMLEALEIPFKVNPNLVRGLDYYTHTAFEITSDQLGAQATVCGGGRYDGLIQQLGGPPTPAIGWAIGMERLILVIEAAAKANPNSKAAQFASTSNPDIYLINQGELGKKIALILAMKLRAEGLCVELDNSGSSFSKQFKRANRSNAPFAIVLGDDEVNKGEGRLKTLLKNSKESSQSHTDKLFSLDDYSNLVRIVRTTDLTKV